MYIRSHKGKSLIENLDNYTVLDIVLRAFLAFLGDDVIVGHNVNFDINFIYDNLKDKLGLYLTNDFVDTLRLSRMLLSFLPRHRLDDLISYFN